MPDDTHIKAQNDDDVEGHKVKPAPAAAQDDGDDVEGHKVKPAPASAQDDGDDAEGHMKV